MLLSKTVLRRKKNALGVIAAITNHGPGLIPKLGQLFGGSRAEGEPASDQSGTLDDLKNDLEEVIANLEQADDAHLAEVANDNRLRRLRDEITTRMLRLLINLSRTIDHSYGAFAAEEELGIGAGLRPIPDQIDVARRAVDKLTPEFQFPRPSLWGVDLVPEELRQEIEEPTRQLGEVLARLRDERKKLELSLRRKNEAVAEFDRVYSYTTLWLKGMFLAAGEPDLARRIRPTIPQPSPPPEDDPPDGKSGRRRAGGRSRARFVWRGLSERRLPGRRLPGRDKQ